MNRSGKILENREVIMLDIVEIGRKIRDKRKEIGMTQGDLAKMLFISEQSVSKWERGVSVPEISNLKKISHILGVSVDYLIDNE
jgi:transcriptional regulator with XRE-family HTH domain